MWEERNEGVQLKYDAKGKPWDHEFLKVKAFKDISEKFRIQMRTGCIKNQMEVTKGIH